MLFRSYRLCILYDFSSVIPVNFLPCYLLLLSYSSRGRFVCLFLFCFLLGISKQRKSFGLKLLLARSFGGVIPNSWWKLHQRRNYSSWWGCINLPVVCLGLKYTHMPTDWNVWPELLYPGKSCWFYPMTVSKYLHHRFVEPEFFHHTFLIFSWTIFL